MSDKSIEKWVLKHSRANQFTRGISVFCARYLLFVEVFGLAIVFILIEPENWFRLGLNLFLLLAVVWSTTTLLQFIFHRDRPFEEGFKPLIKPWIKSPSFPSGHSSLSFAAATHAVLISPEIGIIFLVMAALVALSRIAVGVHFLTDIIVGSIFGTAVALILHFVFNLGT